jgi:uncharacterized protein
VAPTLNTKAIMNYLIKYLFLILCSITVSCLAIRIFYPTIKEFNRRPPFIWEIVVSNKTLYLGGSMHDLPRDNIPNEYESVLSKVSEFYVENNENCDSMLKPLIENENGKLLSDELTKEQLKFIVDVNEKYELGITNIESYTSIGITSKITYGLLSRNNLYREFGVESTLIERIKKNKLNMDVKGMDKSGSCNNFYDLLISNKKNNYLFFNKDYSLFKNEYYLQLLKNWNNGNLDKIHEDNQKIMMPEEKEYMNKRNKAWTEKIDFMLKDENYKSTFIVVGVGHFGGEDGLLNLLAKKGYTVTRMKKL